MVGRVTHHGAVVERWPCPCCGFRTLDQADAYELCAVCFWEDDPHQSRHPHSVDGANGVSLVEGQRSYLRIGAMAPEFVAKVRASTKDETGGRTG